MNKVYVNLVPIMSGGGLQNAINLITGISETIDNKDDYIFITRSTTLEEILEEKKLSYIKIKNTFFSRLKFELLFFVNKKRNLIFTLFGGKPLFTFKNFTISGCAYSNLFYPEIDFWGYLPKHIKAFKKIKDLYRYFLVKSSDVVVFETDTLKSRAIKLKNFDASKTFVVKMAVSKLVADAGEKNKNSDFTKDIVNKRKILYLGSGHPNKRQHLLINLIKEMKLINNNFIFITTMQKNSYSDVVLKQIKEEGLEGYLLNLGTIDTKDAGKLIKECDAIINIAALESFSNNFIEAWTLRKPLILTNEDWAKDSCENSALYINPTDSVESAARIVELLNNQKLQENMVETYNKTLSNYLNYKEKTAEYVELISNFKGVKKN